MRRHFFNWLVLTAHSLLVAFTLSSCSTAQQHRTPLLVISFDGFHPKYLNEYETPNLDQLVRNGVLAEAMIPVFPTNTFPNHYSLVTGLYPEHSGVVANVMYDKEREAQFSYRSRNDVKDASWFGGEPIWVTAERQDVRTATLFWPGSEAPVKGVHPTRWMEYNGGLSHTARVDSIISWLTVQDNSRPLFLTLYFSIVNDYGHIFGPDNKDSMEVAVKRVDDSMGYLVSELKRIGIWPDINIILTSDHGMAQLSLDRVILIDTIIDLNDVQVVDWNIVTMMFPKDGKLDTVYDALKKAESHYRVYKKEEIPDHYRLRNSNRVPPLIIVADVGYSFSTSEIFSARGIVKGDHGYDNYAPEMNALFLAHGPSFRQHISIETFQNIHVYELMCYLLNITPASNDGSLDSLRHVLR